MITVRSTAKRSYLKAYKKHQHKPVRKTAAFTASTVHKTVTASTMEQPGEEQRRLPDSKRSRRFIKNGFTHAQVKARTINPKHATAHKTVGGNSRVRRRRFAQAKTGYSRAQQRGVSMTSKRSLGRETGRKTVALTVRLVRVVVAKIAAVIAAVSTPITTGVVAVIAVIALIVAMLPSWLASYLFDEDAQANAYAAVLMTDDYPYRNQPNGSPNTVTGLYVGSDTDFVLWRINRDLGSVADKPSETVTKLFPKGSIAWQWASEGNLPTWTTITEANKAMPGDILVWRQGARSAQSTNGYVSYIGNVTNDGVVTENYFAGHYYTESITTNHLTTLLTSGQASIKHNPALDGRNTSTANLPSDEIVKTAASQLGKPYVWGAAGQSAFDCSGLTSWTYLRHGFALPRTAQQQYSFIAARGHINHNLNTLRPGDLVFFSPSGSPNNIVHVGIAVGSGKMIHAARPGVGVVIGNIYAGFIGGGRP